jgi:deoxyribodipyrimidine photo-lyase
MHLMWFRRDLRTLDNSALNAACEAAKKSGRVIIAAYIATPKQWQSQHMAPIQADFITRRLQILQQQLTAHGIPLLYAEVPYYKDVATQLSQWINQYGIKELYYNKQYEVNEKARDHQVAEQHPDLTIHAFDDALLVAPHRIRNGKGLPYKVFTAFRKAWLAALSQCSFSPLASPSPIQQQPINKPQQPVDFTFDKIDSHEWPVNDDAVLQQLRSFCIDHADQYEEQRDIPAIDGTSQLSPYLANGLLSPRQCLAHLLSHHPDALFNGAGGFAWLNELVWREFYIHLIDAHPRLVKGDAFQPWTELLPWSADQDHFTAWKAGNTGFPIVDAAMRQLHQRGWMHNRLRMITASFLTKDLLISWRWGEQYFMSQLIDGDFSANNGGWQWCASTGTDAQPYFRIFNPTTQGKRFDPQGAFIRQWLPALAQVPDKFIHEPWHWAEKQGIGLDYPKPIVDHRAARLTAIQCFADSKSLYEQENAHENA